MKKLIINYEGSGIKFTRAFGNIMLLVGVISFISLIIMSLTSEQRETALYYLKTSLIIFFLSLIIYTFATILATIAEELKINNLLIKERLLQSGIEVFIDSKEMGTHEEIDFWECPMCYHRNDTSSYVCRGCGYSSTAK